jgi:NAD(P)-dependent dehydrogenase (short-subunit alcohol dehydrogenase family)
MPSSSSSNSRTFAGKKIWVTGGAGYLGSPIVSALDAQGAATLCIELPGRAEALIRANSLAHTIPVSLETEDLKNPLGWTRRLVEEHGVPDGLVHLAYVSSAGKSLDALTRDDLNHTFTEAVTPTFELCRELGRHMATRGTGSIVLFSSMYGMVPPDPRLYPPPMAPNPIDYGASKAAVIQLAKYFAVHHGPAQVRFNCIAPGPFPNPAAQRDAPGFVEALGRRTALRRIGQSHEIVAPTLFLLSDGASYVTGQTLVVDGGWTVW